MKYFLISTLILSLDSISISSSSFLTTHGGIQLLISIEHQKKMQRLIGYLKRDISNLNTLLDKTLFFYNEDNVRQKKTTVTLDEITTDELSLHIENVLDNYRLLVQGLESVYFEYGNDDVYKEKILPFLKYVSDIVDYSSSGNTESLPSLYDKSHSASEAITMVEELIENAKTVNEKLINERINTMSVWEWLFGY